MTLAPTRRLSPSKLAALAAAVFAIAVSGCRDLTGLPASLPVISDSGVVYAINGAPAGAPTALEMFTGTLLPADAAFLFDIAFDIDSVGHVVILPQRVVANGLATTHTVALRTDTVAYESLIRAPTGGYRADTALVTVPGRMILVQSTNPTACSTSITGTTIFAKIIADVVDPATRQLIVRYTIDPNCGFRSFQSGIPKD
ncbi:MAG TPA: hypothetical protein VN651_11180 [Gemmatimonadaceae bacterium]|nr:hypothetical protein [Gemmatimonadaceae bacterium]